MKVFILVDKIVTKEANVSVYPELVPVDRISGVRKYIPKENEPNTEWTFLRLTGDNTERGSDSILIDEGFDDFVKRLGKKPNIEIIKQ